MTASKRLLPITFVLALFLALFPSNVSYAAGPTCTVDDSGGADYTSISSAVADVGCTTIQVAAGTYNENVTIGRSLAIEGAGSGTTTVHGNNAGSVFYIWSNSSIVSLSGLTITGGNTASGEGGGIQNLGQLTVNNSTINGNTAVVGGGIWIGRGGQLTVNNSTISSNVASYGGGIYNNPNGGQLTMNNSTISGNSATSGGGIFNNSGSLTVSNSTISGNTASGEGGGISNFNLLTLSNSTISGNSATSGGGISNFNQGTGTVSNSIIANSQSGVDCLNTAFLGYTPLGDGGYNLVGDGSCFGGGTGLSGDPRLAALADNGGSTLTHALAPGSPALDAIPHGVNGCGATLTTDQRGLARPFPTGGSCDIGAVEMQPVLNATPVADAGNDTTGAEGTAISLNGSGSSDADGDLLTFQWAYAAGNNVDTGATCTFADNTAAATTITCTDDGDYVVTLTVDDGQGGTDSDNIAVTVSNDLPTSGNLIVDPLLAPINTTVNSDVTFADAGSNDTHTALWDWGDGKTDNGTVNQSNATATNSHSYAVPGVYVVQVTVTDDDGGSVSVAYDAYVVIYDPNAGFVTGGGWINSPAGAYAGDPTLTGKATFGFVAKYQKGANVPTGDTQFQFKASALSFESSSYEWLVVAGAKAKFKGVGTVNDSGNYGFMLTATDGDLNGGGADTFRIKIWDMNNGDTVIYDNQMGADDNSNVGTTLGGGNIVVHTGKGTNVGNGG